MERLQNTSQERSHELVTEESHYVCESSDSKAKSASNKERTKGTSNAGTLLKKGHAQQQKSADQDMVNMFASVWVKVEVNADEETNSLASGAPEVEPFERTRRNKHKRPAKFKCNQCDYATAYRNCLKIHLDGHNGTKPLSCTVCEYSTKFVSALNRHMLIRHQTETASAEKFKCHECEYTTFYKWNLNAHRKKHTQEKQYKCPHCDYSTAFKQHYNKHVKRHNKDDKNMLYKCDQCSFVTRYDGHISRHLAKIHNIVSEKANRCDHCDFSTKLNWRLTIHKTRSKQGEILKCLYCDFETYYMCESKVHKKMHYKELYKNKSQSNDFSSENDMSQVDETISEQNLGADESIENYDGNQSNVNISESQPKERRENYTLDPECINWNNIDVLNTDDKVKPFKCYMCSYSARFKASVQRHFQRRHTLPESRPYKCINCDFSTKTKDQIALHNKRSQSNSAISCDKCKFSTSFKCQFVMHQKTHYDHECPNCNFKCKNKYDMNKHITIIHLGDGLKCKYCGYQATTKETLICHETTHIRSKPFRCSQCDYTSFRKTSLRSHMRRFHGDVIEDDVTIVSENKIQSLKFPVATLLESLQANELQP